MANLDLTENEWKMIRTKMKELYEILVKVRQRVNLEHEKAGIDKASVDLQYIACLEKEFKDLISEYDLLFDDVYASKLTE